MIGFARNKNKGMGNKNIQIQLLLMDVDGTLTDGKIHICADGECFKAFSVKDGYGIKNVLPKYGIRPIIVTGRASEILQYRAGELGIAEVFQGVADKAACLRLICQKYNLTYQEVAYIGDDLNDLTCMELCGVKGCPADAVARIKQISDFVSLRNGGDGAVREFIDWLVERDAI